MWNIVKAFDFRAPVGRTRLKSLQISGYSAKIRSEFVVFYCLYPRRRPVKSAGGDILSVIAEPKSAFRASRVTEFEFFKKNT